MNPTLDLFRDQPATVPPRGQSPMADAIPAYARDSETSEAAALSMVQDAPRLREEVLAVLRARGPLTADEAAAELRESPLSIRPRLTELKQAGLVEDTGVRRANLSGRSAAVLRAVA